MKRRHFGRLLTGATMLGAPVVHAQGQTAGVALVIGNSKYRWEASLPNVRRDAPDIAKAFQALGLKTELLQDAGRDAMRAAVDRFATSARGANLAAFYFAGHGASWDKDTYLVPEDADLANPGTVRSLLSVTAVRDAVKEAGHRLMVFDNCRNNPADGWRQRAAMASARIEAAEQVAASLNEPNTLVLYSTASGRIALDGPPGENSPFAAALLRQLEAPSVDLQALSSKLRRELLIATQCRQLLWDQSTFTAPFLLNRAGKQAASHAVPTHDPSRIVELKNIYPFAHENGLAVPSGLIAYRAPNGSAHAPKIGAFKYTYKAVVGRFGTSIQPALLVVMSVADNDTAEVIYATKDWGVNYSGAFWRFASATLSGNRLVWSNIEGMGNFEFRWQDVNSGVFQGQAGADGTVMREGGIGTNRFTRLDG